LKVFKLPQLHKDLEVYFPETWEVNYYPMMGFNSPPMDLKDIKRALRNPINCKPLSKLAEGKKEVAIVVDDITRPTKAHQILKLVINELKGISSDAIRIIVALGAHGACYRYQLNKKLGESILNQYAVYLHNPFYGNEKFGETTFGTPIEVNSEYSYCDLKIGLGCIVPHPGAGFGGGSKIILPGIASFNSIYHLHGIVEGRKEGKRKPNTGWGKVKDNPMRKDMEEFTNRVGLDMKIDVIVNGKGDTVKVFAGNHSDEFMEGVKYARYHYSTKLEGEFDVIIANVYAKANEAVLGFINWRGKLKEKGTFVLIANPPEGQIPHYMMGVFGKRFSAPLRSKITSTQKLIILSKYKVLDPWLPINENLSWVKDWKEVLEEIKNNHKEPRVAIIPNADIQCSYEILREESS